MPAHRNTIQSSWSLTMLAKNTNSKFVQKAPDVSYQAELEPGAEVGESGVNSEVNLEPLGEAEGDEEREGTQ